MAETDPVPARPAFRETFRSLRVRNFRLFIFGMLVSGVGSWIGFVAAPLLVLQLTHSGVMLGLDAALGTLPVLVFGAWGGLIADRFDNRLAQIWTQVAYCVLTLVLWSLVVTGIVEVWMVFVISFLLGVAFAVDMPVRQSFYLEMVGPEDLTNAMSLNTATFTGARIIGPVVAGVLIGVWGIAPAFLVDAVSYLAVVAALVAMRTSELHKRERVPRARGQVREGLRYVAKTRTLRVPMLLMAVVFVAGYNFSVLLPLLATDTFGGTAATFGRMLALFGVGSLTGALVMAGRTSRADVPRMAWLALVVGVLSILLAVAPVLPAAWALLPFLGAAYIAFPVAGNSTLQLTAADEMRGRVMSIYTVVFIGSTPIGGPIAGWVGEHLGPRVGLAGGGAIAMLAAAVALLALRRMPAASIQ
jgi:predicted MFS family arabinose efflux permease